jgi:glycerol-3-phosphate dehydrogenase (NAD(P)+)
MGLALAEGKSVEEARCEIGQEVEGVQTAREVYLLSQQLGVEMPITQQVHAVLYQALSPLQAVHNLLDRSQKAEAP